MSDSRSYDARHANAVESFGCFAPDIDPNSIAATFALRQGALGSMAFDVAGDMWARTQLSRRDRSLAVISALAAQARDEELLAHVGIGLNLGLAPEEIEEILLHVAAYAGFPAAMASSRRIDKALLAADKAPERSAAAKKSDEERDLDAADVLTTILGDIGRREPADMLAWMEETLGEVGVVTYRWVLGEIWCRPQLSRRDRSIVVIAILVWLGASAELAVHAPAALRHGLSRVEVEEVVNHLSMYAGIPRAAEALRGVREAFARLDQVR